MDSRTEQRDKTPGVMCGKAKTKLTKGKKFKKKTKGGKRKKEEKGKRGEGGEGEEERMGQGKKR